MPDPAYLAAAVATAALITFALRALPFTLIEPLRTSTFVADLSARMPAGVMVILVLYLLRDVPAGAPGGTALGAAALGLTVALHWWRGNAMLSIAAGTASYVAAVNALG